jgi:hypothetical protein
MPVPASINDLSTTVASNSPAGTETPTDGDNYLRTFASFIALLRDMLNGTTTSTLKAPTVTGTPTFSGTAATWSGNPTHSGNHTFSGTVGVTGLATHSAGLTAGNVAQASATTLDWYEEGTLTLALTSTGGTPSGTATGTYVRIGNRVFLDVVLSCTDWSTCTGQVIITGLPFTAAAAGMLGGFYGGGSTSATAFFGLVSASGTSIGLKRATGANYVASDAITIWAANLSGYYRV